MKKCLLVVLALFFSAGTIFSEITLNSALLLSSSIESRFGFLLYETNNSSWFYAEKFNAELFFHSNDVQKDCSVSMDARYLYGNSDRADCNGKLHFGSVNTAFSKNGLQIRAGFGAFAIPNSLQILSGKPRFILNDSSGLFITIGGQKEFYLFNKDWNISADFLFGKMNVASGDMYYFYGRPDNFILAGGKTTITAPYGISFFSLAGNLSADLDTDTDIDVGNLKNSLCAFYLAKEFQIEVADYFSIKPFVGYAFFSSNGSILLTPANQTYSLFPFKHVGGDYDVQMHFLSTGFSLGIKKGGFSFSFDFLYLVCIQNNNSGKYSYQFKKNLFFDGSSGKDDIHFPNMAGSHIFAGVMEASYRFNTLRHFVPTIKITKIIVAAILSPEAIDFLSEASSSYSTVSDSSPTNSEDPSFSEIIKRALLSGTSIAIKIEF